MKRQILPDDTIIPYGSQTSDDWDSFIVLNKKGKRNWHGVSYLQDFLILRP